MFHLIQTIDSDPKEKRLIADGIARLLEPPNRIH
jgi:hypothetical protein